MSQQPSVTQMLAEWSAGKEEALDALMPLVYDELRRIARNYLRRENVGHTLQPTALVHEAFIRLTGQQRVSWQNRAHFYAIAAKMMRRVLVNYAETKHAEKRGGNHARKVELDEAILFCEQRNLDLLALDEALKKLGEFDSQLCQIVEMKFFGGLTNEEVAEVSDISLATVKREWSTAKTWLLREMSGER
ncbi:MAG: ECF-type sigma factor [Pyrinomonadaceae bacterium]